MCWTTKKGNLKPKVAKRNIKVIKVLDEKNFSPVYPHKYFLNKQEEKVNINIQQVTHPDYKIKYFINSGYHSYSKKYKVTKTNFGLILKYKDIIKNWEVELNLKTQNFIIPKGATYYLNEHGEYVSDTIIMTQK